MQELYNKILELVKKNNACAMATVVSSSGSSPRKIGAKMVVSCDGSILGSIGGGGLEKLVIADALAALKRKKTFLKEYPLDRKSGLQVCGGRVSIFIEVVERQKTLVIAGAGHIGLALSFIAKLLDFRIIILDNRREFANESRFPHADKIICGPYKKGFKKLTLDKDSFIVVVTHGHAHDAACLASTLKTKAGYVGMIGSRAKIRHVFEGLLKKRFKKAQLDKVYTPIGLDINAETPEEIAVAIAAQLVKVYRKVK
jgi:xanthine dehydrogenase accessory factor